MTSAGRSGCTFPVYYYAPSRLPSPSISYFLFSTTVFSIQCLQSWDYAKLTCIISNCSPQYPSQNTAHISGTNAHIEKPQFTFSFFFGWGMRVRGAEVWECRIFAAKDNVHHLLFFFYQKIYFLTLKVIMITCFCQQNCWLFFLHRICLWWHSWQRKWLGRQVL